MTANGKSPRGGTIMMLNLKASLLMAFWSGAITPAGTGNAGAADLSSSVGVDVAPSSCPLVLAGGTRNPTLAECRSETMKDCPSDIKLKCQGLELGANSPQEQAGRNINLPKVPPCPIKPGTIATLPLCQHRDTQARGACPTQVLASCKVLLDNAFWAKP